MCYGLRDYAFYTIAYGACELSGCWEFPILKLLPEWMVMMCDNYSGFVSACYYAETSIT
jgi:hypothetical protein